MSNESITVTSSVHSNPVATRPKTNPSLRNIGAMLLLAIMWGLSIPMTKFGLMTLPPLTMTALRFAIAVPLMLLFIVGKPKPPLRAVPRLAVLGVFGIGIGQITQSLGVAGISASVGAVISATIPVFIVILAAQRLKQRVSSQQTLGLLAAFVGVLMVTLGNGGNALDTSGSSPLGVGLMLVSALALSFYSVWSIELTDAHGATTVAAWSTLFGFLTFLPLAGWEIWDEPPHITAEVIGAALYLGIVVTVAGLFLWLHLLHTVPARTAAYVQYLQPIIGIGASALMFGDKLGLLFGAGVILVLIGLALSMRSQGKHADEPQAAR